jgi:hypothetical protein
LSVGCLYSLRSFSANLLIVFNLENRPFNGKLFFHIKSIYCVRGPGGVKACRRIIGIRTGFVCVLIYTSEKV